MLRSTVLRLCCASLGTAKQTGDRSHYLLRGEEKKEPAVIFFFSFSHLG